jgi:hypothetical protein
MATKKTSGKQLADMLYGKPDGAAFGVYPQAGKRGQAKPTAQDQVTQLFSDDRAVPLPQFGDNDLSVPTAGNRAMGQRMVERDVDLKRQADRDMSPLEKLAGGMQTGRLMGSGLVQAVKSIPTAVTKGGKAAEEYIAENIYKPTQPKAYEYAQDIGDFLTSLETDYKIPPVLPEALALQGLMGPATRQATRQGALNLAAPRTLNPQAGVFIGPKAKTFNKGKADMAIAMEEAGRTPAEIWQATGTFRGADGILRQEIDDRAAKFLSASDRQERIDATKGKIAEMKERIKPTTQKDLFPKALTEAKKELRDDISILKSDINLREKNPRTQGLMAQHIFEHPELYAAYPELQSSVKIITEGGRGGNARGALSIAPSRGHFPGSMEMDIYDAGLRGNPTSTALHEMQHAVQTIEGMGPGGNPTFAFANPEAHDILKRLREDVYKPSSFEDFQRVNKFPEDEAQAAYEQYVKERKANPITSDKIERSMQETAAMEYYKRLLGEAEARAVQDRQMMTPAQRMEYPPPTSYDVPQEDLIVKPPREYAEGGRVHFSDNPDVMQLELAGGGIVRMGVGGAMAKTGTKGGAKAAKEAVKPNLVIKSKPGIIVSDLIDEDPEIAKRLGALARAKRQADIAAEGKRLELAKQTQPSVGYRQTTEKKPDPLVGTRFINEAPFGLNPNDPFDLGKFQGASGLVLPWDSQSRNVKTTQVSGMDLPNQIFRSTHGGVPYSFDTQHAARGIVGSSGEDISKRVKTRADTAVRENIDLGGSGELLHMPITMGFRAEDYALPYSEFSFDLINYKLMTGELTLKQAEELANMVRNFEPPKYKGKKPFADFAGFTSPEGLEQIYTGQGINAPSGELRKAIADRIIHQKGSQEKLGFNAEDLMNATTYEPLRGVDKGFIGSSVMRNTPTGMQLSPSAGKYPYDTDFSGEHLGRLEDNVDVEALFYRTLNPIKRELMDRETKKPYTRESLRNAAIGAIEKRNENVSQMIDQQFLDDYDTYITELRKPTEYKKGGRVRKYAEGGEITADDLILEERKL